MEAACWQNWNSEAACHPLVNMQLVRTPDVAAVDIAGEQRTALVDPTDRCDAEHSNERPPENHNLESLALEDAHM